MREVVRKVASHFPTAIISGRSCDKVHIHVIDILFWHGLLFLFLNYPPSSLSDFAHLHPLSIRCLILLNLLNCTTLVAMEWTSWVQWGILVLSLTIAAALTSVTNRCGNECVTCLTYTIPLFFCCRLLVHFWTTKRKQKKNAGNILFIFPALLLLPCIFSGNNTFCLFIWETSLFIHWRVRKRWRSSSLLASSYRWSTR